MILAVAENFPRRSKVSKSTGYDDIPATLAAAALSDNLAGVAGGACLFCSLQYRKTVGLTADPIYDRTSRKLAQTGAAAAALTSTKTPLKRVFSYPLKR